MKKKELTLTQKQIFDMTESEAGDYSIGTVCLFDGKGNETLIKESISQIIKENDVFHISFERTDDGLLQFFDENRIYDVKVLKFSSSKEFDIWRENNEKTQISYDKTYDFVGVIIGDTSFGFYIRIHHIIADAMAVGIITMSFEKKYSTELRESLEVGSYITAIDEAHKYLQSERYQKDKEYWENVFFGVNEVTKIVDKQITNYNVERKAFLLSKEQSEKITKFSQEKQVSILYVYMSAFAMYIANINRTDSVNIASTMHNRFGRNAKHTIGAFVDTLLFRIDLDRNASFSDLVSNTHKKVYEGLNHSKYNYTHMKKMMAKEQGQSLNLLDVIINYQSAHKDFERAVDVEWKNCSKQFNSLTVSICDWENEGQYEIDFDYLDCLFSEKEICNIHRLVMNYLMTAIDTPEKTINSISCVDESDYQVYENINAKRNVKYPTQENIVTLFERQVDRRGTETALICKDKTYSYDEVNQRANVIATKLIQSGVSTGDYVALVTDRTANIIFGILGIAKAGAAYVPVDPNYPTDRIEYMATDCGVKAILVATENDIIIEHSNVLYLNDFDYDTVNDNVNIDISPENELYVIYTSGTTGKPKGVPIRHENVVRLLFNDAFQFDFSEKDTWLLFHYYGFDFSVWEMYGALLYGGRLVIPSLEETRDVFAIVRLINDKQISVLNQVPSAFYAMILAMGKQTFHSLRYLIFGGEMLEPRKLAEWKKVNPQVKIINMYGITETTVHVTYKEIGTEEIERGVSDIGTPIPTLGVYILYGDSLCGVGMPGELCVVGDGLSRGYLNRKELTEKKFVSLLDISSETIYRSGDLARLQENGSIEYLGRIDRQVKINGFRIELSEIENAIRTQKAYPVKDCVVIDRIDTGEKRNLFAYIVSDQPVDYSVIKQEIRKRIPVYMIPLYWDVIDEIPLTKNGKLDCQALPMIENPLTDDIVAPRNKKEEQILNIFKSVLGFDVLGVTNDFYDCGGDSIKSMMVAAKMKEIGYEITSKELMENPSVEAVAQICREVEFFEQNDEQVQGEVMNSPIYSYFVESKLQVPTYYNQAVLLKSKSIVNVDYVRQALNELVKHHDVLRARWQNEHLFIDEEASYEKYVDVNTFKVSGDKELTEVCSELQKSFSFQQGALFKVAVISMTDGEEYIFFVAHHVVIDGVSWRILLEDFIRLYQGLQRNETVALQAKTTSIQKWAEMISEYASSSAFSVIGNYWDRQVEKLCRGCTMPEKYDDEGIRHIDIQFPVDDMKKALKQFKDVYGMDAATFYLEIFSVTLSKMLESNNLTIHMEGHGRENINDRMSLERTIGWFTTIYPIQINITEDLKSDLIHIKDTLKIASSNQIGYGIKKYILQENVGECMPNIIFNYLGDFNTAFSANEYFELAEKDIGELVPEQNKVGNVFTINGGEKKDRIQFDVEIGKKYFSEKDAEKFRDEVQNTLANMIVIGFDENEKQVTMSDVSSIEMSDDEWAELCDAYFE